MENTKKVPVLRFPEFSGVWEVKKLGDLVEIQSGLSPSNFELLEKGKYPFLKVEELNNCQKYQYDSRNYIDLDKNLIPAESIIFPKRGMAILNNKVRITKIASQMDSNLMAIFPKKNKINTEFLFYKIYSEKLYKIADTSSIPQINNKHIEPYKIKIPEIKEQQKIADFISQIDSRIEKIVKKKQLLERYKKGVMQKIFNQELRFKDDNGNDYLDWEIKEIGKISNPKQWATISAIDLLDSGYAVYGANSFIGYYSEYNHEFETVTVTCRGATCGSVSLIPEKSYITGNSMCLDDIESTIYNYKFIYYSISFRGFGDIISGSAQPQIIGSAIKKVKINIPHLEEQTKIADFLNEIDCKINIVSKQLEGTKKYKNGLLKKMFV